MKTSGSLAALAALAAFALTTNATAQTSTPEPAAVELRWDAPSECPTGDRILDDARTLARNQNTTSPSGPVAVEAVVERLAADRWTLRIGISGAQQRLEASTCAQLARAAALFVALVMAPARAEPAGTPAPSPPAPPPSPAPSGPPPPMPMEEGGASARPRGPRDVWALAAAGLLIDAGTLPGPELLGALELGIRYRRVEVRLQGAVGAAQSKTLDGAAGARLRPLITTATLCYTPLSTGRLRLGPCGQGEVGWIHAEGIGLSQTSATDAAWLSLGGELAVWWVAGPGFEVRLGAGVLIPVVVPDFELTGLGSVFQPGVAVRAGTAAVIRF